MGGHRSEVADTFQMFPSVGPRWPIDGGPSVQGGRYFSNVPQRRSKVADRRGKYKWEYSSASAKFKHD